MKVSKDFILREIAGEIMLVPVGAAAAKFNGLITMNEVGKFIFEALGQERDIDTLADMICAEYEIDKDTAAGDAAEFLQQLREVGALVE